MPGHKVVGPKPKASDILRTDEKTCKDGAQTDEHCSTSLRCLCIFEQRHKGLAEERPHGAIQCDEQVVKKELVRERRQSDQKVEADDKYHGREQNKGNFCQSPGPIKGPEAVHKSSLMAVEHIALNLINRQNGVETVYAQEEDCDVNRSDARVHVRFILRSPVACINRAEEKCNDGGNNRSDSIVAGRTPINLPHSLEYRRSLCFGRRGMGGGKCNEIVLRRLAVKIFDIVQGILVKLRRRKRRSIIERFLAYTTSSARHGQHPSCRILAGLDLVGGWETLKILDEFATFLTQFAEECGMAALLEQEKGVKIVENCHGRLMNGCDHSAPTISNAPHTFHNNAGSPSVESGGWLV
mmetsp:Transcript_3459/g.5971  ORF Transcript_3459/g.5971 Transcript_3459/m.5971 type:complete len:354 (-) Transcript_3459:185-1246(-)